MKKHLFTILSVCVTGFITSQTLPNAGFESWTVASYENPANYMTSNMQSNNNGVGAVNAFKTTDAFHGNYALRLNTLVSGVDTLMAFAAVGDPGQSPAQGGLPYNQKPTGLTFHYKSNIISGDSALVFVEFKKSGISIGSYMYTIGNTQASYGVFSRVFNPALPQIPDTVVFAFASSNAFANVAKAGNMLEVDSLNFTGVAFQPPSFDGDFETWQTFTTSRLNNWITFDNATRTTDNYNGTYALELQTSSAGFGGNGSNQTGFAMTGRWVPMGAPAGGHPYTQQIDTLVLLSLIHI